MKFFHALLLGVLLQSGLTFANQISSVQSEADLQRFEEALLMSTAEATSHPSCSCAYPPSASYCSVTCNEGERAICKVSPVTEECRCYCK